MSTLSALLAKQHAVPPNKLDEAIQRQVLNGGDFETNLLEVQALSEDLLTRYRAESLGMPPADREQLALVSASILSKIGRVLCEAHKVLPLRMEGEALVIAVVDPLAPEALATLEKAVGSKIIQYASTSFRLAWALAKHYGTELTPRFRRLATRLSTTPSGAMLAVEPPKSLTPSGTASATPNRPVAAVKVKSAVMSALSALTQVLEDEEDGDDENEDGPTIVERVRVSRAQAEQQIGEAVDRDAILSVVMAYAAQRMSYVALFVVQGEVAEGLDARGSGTAAAAVRRVGVPLDATGVFRAARERGAPVVGALNSSGTDAIVKQELGREGADTVAVIPIHIGGRVVLLLWADQGNQALDLAAVDELTAVCGLAADGFERIIRDKKAKRLQPAKMDASKVTVGTIARRVAEQRGIQTLRALAAREANDDSPKLDVSGEDAMVSLPPAPNVPSGVGMESVLEIEPVAEAAAQNDEPLQEPVLIEPAPPAVQPVAAPETTANRPRNSERPQGLHSSGTRYAGRAPVAVDVIGPLPSPRRPSSFPARDGAPDEMTLLKLVSEVVRTGVLEHSVADRLVAEGERSLAAVFRYFPGPTKLDRSSAMTRIPNVADVGPLLRLVVMFRQLSAPFLTETLESPDPEQRFYAILCLSEVIHPAAATALGQRLFDSDEPSRRLAMEALRSYRRLPEFDRVLRLLRNTLNDSNAAPERRRLAANGLADLRDGEALSVLISALGDSDASLRAVVRYSLVQLARQDFGENVAQWREWEERAAGRHRVEWLIEALAHDEPTIRNDASEELKKLTGYFAGYYFNLPKRERERAQAQYREWWDREGRSRFVR